MSGIFEVLSSVVCQGFVELSLSSLPTKDLTHRLIGRSQATTGAQNRVELVYQSLGFCHAITQNAGTAPAQNEVNPGMAVLYRKP